MLASSRSAVAFGSRSTLSCLGYFRERALFDVNQHPTAPGPRHTFSARHISTASLLRDFPRCRSRQDRSRGQKNEAQQRSSHHLAHHQRSQTGGSVIEDTKSYEGSNSFLNGAAKPLITTSAKRTYASQAALVEEEDTTEIDNRSDNKSQERIHAHQTYPRSPSSLFSRPPSDAQALDMQGARGSSGRPDPSRSITSDSYPSLLLSSASEHARSTGEEYPTEDEVEAALKSLRRSKNSAARRAKTSRSVPESGTLAKASNVQLSPDGEEDDRSSHRLANQGSKMANTRSSASQDGLSRPSDGLPSINTGFTQAFNKPRRGLKQTPQNSTSEQGTKVFEYDTINDTLGSPEIERVISQELKANTSDDGVSLASKTPSTPVYPRRLLPFRTVISDDLKAAEQRFSATFPPDTPVADESKDALLRHVNHLLYLAASISSRRAYNRISHLLSRYELEADSWTYVTHLILCDKLDETDQIAAIWQAYVDHREKQKIGMSSRASNRNKSGIVCLNLVIWLLAKRAKWQEAQHIYFQLRNNLNARHAVPEHEASIANFAVPRDILPDRITYISLIRALAWHGNLSAALSVLEEFISHGGGRFRPDVSVFVSLFQGFARFGQVPTSSGLRVRDFWLRTVHAHEAQTVRILPDPIYPEPFPLDSTKSLEMRPKPTSTLQRIADIWSGSREQPERFVDVSAEWTMTALDRLFIAFLSIRPQPDIAADRAPTPRAIYYLLVAFARMTNEDKGVLRTVWADVETKFGPNNQEGWRNWRTDARLERIRKHLELSDTPSKLHFY